ncbi:recombinase family protein [Flavobacterium sp.]|uniref:recombinase family protein n=1 Tax=Flavobacterium sp. TaxID=239 RepID=UPI0024892C6E|nr:recombinase family protein [Flavobacterium sp.]MDI1317910.1 recombinase family protein [Flavobacterium sp.]
MHIKYSRISSISQRNDRQVQNTKDFDFIIEDTCSGSIPFFEREGGKRIEKMVAKNEVTKISAHSIDRFGRDLLDVLNSIKYFSQKGICIEFSQQGLRTLDDDNKENPISKMIISILGVVAEMERNLIRERQLEGIAIAKAKGTYKGRAKGTSLSNLDFLNKPKVKKAIDLIEKGYKQSEIATIVRLHPNTLSKIKKTYQSVNNGK